VSSVVAVGPAAGAEDELDEDSAFDGDRLRCDYVDTKREAERLALAAAGDLEVVVVNPGAVFGPARSLSNTSHFLETLIERPWTGLVAPPGSMSCVGVSDVARGIVSALRAGRSGRRYLLTECNLRLDELYRRVLAACGRPPRVLRVPPPAWRAVVAASRVVDRIRPASLATPQSLGLLGAHFRFSSRRAHAELGWSPAPFDEVLARTLDWLGARRGGAEARCRPSPGEERP